MSRTPITRARHAIAAGIVAGSLLLLAGGSARAGAAKETTPIQHVVIIDQENHSFDNLLGDLCVEVAHQQFVRPGSDDGCDGRTVGTLPNGKKIALATATDVVAGVHHSVASQQTSMDGGNMDGFARIGGCKATQSPAYRCYSQYHQSQIPNAWNFAADFTISDRTFEQKQTPSWTGHLVLAAATTDGFQGDNPTYVAGPGVPHRGPGWGCDSNKQTGWWNGTSYQSVPSCIPDQAGNGPFTGPGTSPVPYVPTIFDRMDDADVSWKIYGADGSTNPHVLGYLWTMCPSFYECLGSSQDQKLVPAENVIGDGRSGDLPAVSFVTPLGTNSQHNRDSMLTGDNWIGQILDAIEHGPDWDTTAVFLTWDDCGCFYDHVNPLQFGSDWGIRVPMIIVSPYAKQGSTDSTPAVFASLLAYVEHTFGLPALAPCGGAPGCTDDTNVYDYANAFDYSQAPLPPIPVTRSTIPGSEQWYLQTHPARPDVT